MRRFGQFARQSPLAVILPSIGVAILAGYAYFNEVEKGDIGERVTVIEREVVPCVQSARCLRWLQRLQRELQRERREGERRRGERPSHETADAAPEPVTTGTPVTSTPRDGGAGGGSVPPDRGSSGPPGGSIGGGRERRRPPSPRRSPAPEALQTPPVFSPPPEKKPPADPAPQAKAKVEANLPELPVVGQQGVCVGNCK